METSNSLCDKNPCTINNGADVESTTTFKTCESGDKVSLLVVLTSNLLFFQLLLLHSLIMLMLIWEVSKFQSNLCQKIKKMLAKDSQVERAQ